MQRAGQLILTPLGSQNLGIDSFYISLQGRGRNEKGGALTAASDTTVPVLLSVFSKKAKVYALR